MVGDWQLCAAHCKDGSACGAPALAGRTYCYMHDPEYEPQRAASRSKGGQNTSRVKRLQKLTPPDLIPVFAKIAHAIDEVHDGQISPSVATAMANLAAALCKILSAGEVEQRLRELEDRVGEGAE